MNMRMRSECGKNAGSVGLAGVFRNSAATLHGMHTEDAPAMPPPSSHAHRNRGLSFWDHCILEGCSEPYHPHCPQPHSHDASTSHSSAPLPLHAQQKMAKSTGDALLDEWLVMEPHGDSCCAIDADPHSNECCLSDDEDESLLLRAGAQTSTTPVALPACPCRWEGCAESFATPELLLRHVIGIHICANPSTNDTSAVNAQSENEMPPPLPLVVSNRLAEAAPAPGYGNMIPQGTIDPTMTAECHWDDCHAALPAQPALAMDHFVQHTRFQPYTCNLAPNCNARFAQLAAFQHHAADRHGHHGFICTYPGCGRRYVHLRSLRKHQRQHPQAWRDAQALIDQMAKHQFKFQQ